MTNERQTADRQRWAGTKQWLFSFALCALALLACGPAQANSDALRARLHDYLLDQTRSLPGQVDVTVTLPSASLPTCHAPAPFLPGNGARPWGRTTVGVKCPGDRPATRYYQAYVAVTAPYYVAAHAIDPGDVITEADIQSIDGDLTRLSSTVVTDPSVLIGQAAARRIGEGMPLTDNMVRPRMVVKRGSQVHVIARGTGFSITSQGKALNDAQRGATVRVRTESGKIIVGKAQDSNSVIVSL